MVALGSSAILQSKGARGKIKCAQALGGFKELTRVTRSAEEGRRMADDDVRGDDNEVDAEVMT